MSSIRKPAPEPALINRPLGRVCNLGLATLGIYLLASHSGD